MRIRIKRQPIYNSIEVTSIKFRTQIIRNGERIDGYEWGWRKMETDNLFKLLSWQKIYFVRLIWVKLFIDVHIRHDAYFVIARQKS